MPSSFSEEELWNFRSLFLCFFVQLVTSGAGQVLAQMHHMNKHGSGPQADTTYQISNF